MLRRREGIAGDSEHVVDSDREAFYFNLCRREVTTFEVELEADRGDDTGWAF